jgi:hypothetical protein
MLESPRVFHPSNNGKYTTSPQGQAWKWLTRLDANYWELGKELAQQKFSLATLYYATSSSSWMAHIDNVDTVYFKIPGIMCSWTP